jgi:hypothetical protein
MAEEDPVGWLGAPVDRGILWQFFKVFGHVIHRVPRNFGKGRGRSKPTEVQSDARDRRNHLNGAESGAARRSLDHFDENTEQDRSPNCRLRAVNPADRIRAKSVLGHRAECGAGAEIRFHDEAGERIVKRTEAGR